MYQEMSLRDFIGEKPWIEQQNCDNSNEQLDDSRDARDRFCNDAFEIGWNIEKAIFLLDQVQRTAKDWICFDSF